ncbi:RES domain-containing protein [Arthrobacter sp.]|uniref:RES domain-containing protein n=1 Tax=Arthrobacter sp. TaxID=1667 RepID=UPI0026E0CCF7|nr:RES domain-containing protein [Arthrobacter sp.]MDO5753191.1 RES domain-containing protein [Arthrobacter sp.]
MSLVETVWRVGFQPTPWAWSGWEWASNGRFPGRWDDLEGNFRTAYAGSSLLGCLLEVLACFRKDPRLALDLLDIAEDDQDKVLYPSVVPGTVPLEWLDGRTAATALMSGTFCAVTAAESVAALYPQFIGMALGLGLTDFDAAALKDAKPRALTQAIASHIYATGEFHGVQFSSRHGDDLRLWAIFEQPGDPSISPRLGHRANHELYPDNSDVLEAFRLLGLKWDEQ